MAWQGLFAFEKALNDKAPGFERSGDPQGWLTITTNNFKKGGIRRDYVNDSNPSQPRFRVIIKLVRWSELDHLPNTYLSNLYDRTEPDARERDAEAAVDAQQQLNTILGDPNNPNAPEYLERQILAISREIMFIAYTIDYEIELRNRCRFLNTDSLTTTFRFFPFRRPLFHAAEAILDQLLHNAIANNTWLKVTREWRTAMLLEDSNRDTSAEVPAETGIVDEVLRKNDPPSTVKKRDVFIVHRSQQKRSETGGFHPGDLTADRGNTTIRVVKNKLLASILHGALCFDITDTLFKFIEIAKQIANAPLRRHPDTIL
jgi:hypothetical protein